MKINQSSKNMYSQRRTGVSAAHMLVKVDHFVRMALGALSRKVRERGGTTRCGVRGGWGGDGSRWERLCTTSGGVHAGGRADSRTERGWRAASHDARDVTPSSGERGLRSGSTPSHPVHVTTALALRDPLPSCRSSRVAWATLTSIAMDV